MSTIAPISVIVPCHDAENTMLRALQSVAGQTVQPAEVVIAEDASTDGTPDLLARCGREPWPFELKVVQLEELARDPEWHEMPLGVTSPRRADTSPSSTPTTSGCPENSRSKCNGWSAIPTMAGLPMRAACYLERLQRKKNSAVPEGVSGFAPLSRRRLLFRNPVATPAVMARCPTPSCFRGDWDRCEDLMLWLDWIDTGFAGALLDAPLALLGRAPKTPGGLTGDLRLMFASELRVLDTLVSERRMSACMASLWKVYAGGRFKVRMLRA